jgi:hypothetical protein
MKVRREDIREIDSTAGFKYSLASFLPKGDGDGT